MSEIKSAPSKDGVRCPSWASERQENSGLIGCGSTNILWDGFEMWDCLDCGLFFTTEEGTEPEVTPTCDYCGQPDGPGVPDWNGETGNHASCEVGSHTVVYDGPFSGAAEKLPGN
jgi:hypothetical protein